MADEVNTMRGWIATICVCLAGCAQAGEAGGMSDPGPLATGDGVVVPGEAGSQPSSADAGAQTSTTADPNTGTSPTDTGETDPAADAGTAAGPGSSGSSEPPEGNESSEAGTPDGSDPNPGDDSPDPRCVRSSNTFPTARSLGAVDGDRDAQLITATGTGSEWLAVTLSDNGGLMPVENSDKTIKARLMLSSSAGTNYDMFVYRDGGGGASEPPRDCSSNRQAAESTGNTDLIDVGWSDDRNAIVNEEAGDTKIVSIEIRHASGPCAEWSLNIQGNTP